LNQISLLITRFSFSHFLFKKAGPAVQATLKNEIGSNPQKFRKVPILDQSSSTEQKESPAIIMKFESLLSGCSSEVWCHRKSYQIE
jgi:hypothetical protein